MRANWYQAKVIHGRNLGKVFGFPTLNLDTPYILIGNREGVYTVRIRISNNLYQGILYFGPKLILGEKENILEIYIFNFDKQIYGESVIFQLVGFIRGVKNFKNISSFRKQLTNDCQKANKILNSSK